MPETITTNEHFYEWLNRPVEREESSAIFCGHANEMPGVCDCPAHCYCQNNSCRNRQWLSHAVRDFIFEELEYGPLTPEDLVRIGGLERFTERAIMGHLSGMMDSQALEMVGSQVMIVPCLGSNCATRHCIRCLRDRRIETFAIRIRQMREYLITRRFSTYFDMNVTLNWGQSMLTGILKAMERRGVIVVSRARIALANAIVTSPEQRDGLGRFDLIG